MSYTSRYFRRSLNCSIKHVLGCTNPSGKGSRKTESTEATRAFQAQRLDLLCLLDRDGKISQRMLICSICSTTHAKWRFLPGSSRTSNTERACAGTIGRLWHCPHWICDYEEVHHWPSRSREEIVASKIFCSACLGFVTHLRGKPFPNHLLDPQCVRPSRLPGSQNHRSAWQPARFDLSSSSTEQHLCLGNLLPPLPVPKTWRQSRTTSLLRMRFLCAIGSMFLLRYCRRIWRTGFLFWAKDTTCPYPEESFCTETYGP